jgi:hypothetical protein
MAKFKLTVPIDASSAGDAEKGQPLKVVARDGSGRLQSQVVQLRGGKASATFTFDEKPSGVRVFVGPEDTPDDQMDKLQTISANVRSLTGAETVLSPIVIGPYYWYWWRRWCRTFSVRGRVLCADGSPVPGAKVCAYDVDWFWWWRSIQQVGNCVTTDANGAFQITFKWCCGWWPWWWWQLRKWELDPGLYRRIVDVLPPELKINRIPLPDPMPDLALLETFAAAAKRLAPQRPGTAVPRIDFPAASGIDGIRLNLPGAGLSNIVLPNVPPPEAGGMQPVTVGSRQIDFGRVEALREPLTRLLPKVAELEALRIWPWWPFNPWYDCAPDLVFRVTQDCGTEKGVVIYDENTTPTHFDIPTSFDVTLTANEKACCILPSHPGSECLTYSHICWYPLETIGGNDGAPPTPQGYLHPGTGDIPFGGNVTVYGTSENMDGVDYYGFEWWRVGASVAWEPIPLPSLGPLNRAYLDHTIPFDPNHPVPFAPATIDGQDVYESLPHYEATHPGPAWGSSLGRQWVGITRDLLLSWLTSTPTWTDGLYKLRARSYVQQSDGTLLLRDPQLPVCGTTDHVGEVLVRIDNRLEDDPGHATGPGHSCGTGTIHHCVTEPDTDIVSVKVLPAGTLLEPCSQGKLSNDQQVEIVFFAHDPNGHLQYFELRAYYGENQYVDLLSGYDSLTGTAVAGMPAGAPGNQTSYNAATGPLWTGGAYRLVVPAEKFEKTCCYTLWLYAVKRTYVSCGWPVHANQSSYSFMIEKI